MSDKNKIAGDREALKMRAAKIDKIFRKSSAKKQAVPAAFGSNTLRIGFLPCVADIYSRMWGKTLFEDFRKMINQVARELEHSGLPSDSLNVVVGQIASSQKEVERSVQDLLSQRVDLLMVVLFAYCPSGVIAPTLLKTDIPVLLCPLQSLFKLDPKTCNGDMIKFNHGVHGVQDLANVLRKNKKPFGVMHGHWYEKGYSIALRDWAKAGRALSSMKDSHPLLIGGHFSDMLDLQIAEKRCIRKLGCGHHEISMDEFSRCMNEVNAAEIEEHLEKYHSLFEISPNISETMLRQTAQSEIALRALMETFDSKACGLNFLTLCNDGRIRDALHVGASILMSEGGGYGAEGDWVTAAFVYAMQQSFGVASLSEIFSVSYEDNRLLLKHMGEGNFAMARQKPRLMAATVNDQRKTEFPILDFEFMPGNVTLVNFNSTDNGCGQILSIRGMICEDHLPLLSGPRAIFQPVIPDVKEVLNEYAYAGGSHHFTLVQNDCRGVLEKVARLAGWQWRDI